MTLVVPFIGWLFGIAMVLISKAWTNREKTIGTLALLAVVPPHARDRRQLLESPSETFEVLFFVLWVIGGLPRRSLPGLAATAS